MSAGTVLGLALGGAVLAAVAWAVAITCAERLWRRALAEDWPCTCGHVAASHEHHHDRRYCGLCGRDACPTFHPAPREAR